MTRVLPAMMFLLVSGIFSASASAGGTPDHFGWNSSHSSPEVMEARKFYALFSKVLEDFRADVTQTVATPTARFGAPDGLKCQRFYRDLYSEATLLIQIEFGFYDDSESPMGQSRGPGFSYDGAVRAALWDHLIEPCPPGSSYQVCGFSPVAQVGDESPMVTRSVAGPDGRRRQVLISLGHSSDFFSYDPRAETERRQRAVSESARSEFLRSARQADVVLYFGHSRVGGGPDFFPPRLDVDSGHVDYGWYIENTPGLKALLNALRLADAGKPKLLGLFSCKSIPHFEKAIHQVRPDLPLVGTYEVDPGDVVFRGIPGVLDAILGEQCADGMRYRISNPGDSGAPRAGSVGLFE